MNNDQFIRKIGLILFSTEGNARDFSNFRITFNVQNADVESPNNAAIRIYGLSRKTINELITGCEYQSVSLNAGYNNGNYGIIFSGDIKQFRYGKEDAVTMYMDILAADGDVAYNQAFLNESIAAGQGGSLANSINGIAKSMNLDVNYGIIKATNFEVPSIRGKVRMGMARSYMRNAVRSSNAGWSIQNGKLQITDNSAYMPGEVVILNSATGMVGIPEQTDEGIRVTCLLNSRLSIGGLVQIDNSSVNKLVFTRQSSGPFPYDKYKGLQPLAPLSDDGLYRVFVVEHEGDTRGNNWYSHIICLAMDPVNKTVIEYPEKIPNGTVTVGELEDPL